MVQRAAVAEADGTALGEAVKLEGVAATGVGVTTGCATGPLQAATTSMTSKPSVRIAR
jgi:hypothetical protein